MNPTMIATMMATFLMAAAGSSVTATSSGTDIPLACLGDDCTNSGAPTAAAGSSVAAILSETDIALACLGNGCVSSGDSCLVLAAASMESNCNTSEKKCSSDWWNYQMWHAEGGNDAGTGSVEFYVQCGTQELGVCDTVKLPHCKGEDEVGDGTLGCFYRILDGSPEGILGRCVDPVNPAIAYEAIPEGLPYDAVAHLIQL